MKCSECGYRDTNGTYNMCAVTCKILNFPGKKQIVGCSDVDNIKEKDICYNCKHWIGGGDWGLSCRKDYYVASSNGFNKACEKFEGKETIQRERF